MIMHDRYLDVLTSAAWELCGEGRQEGPHEYGGRVMGDA